MDPKTDRTSQEPRKRRARPRAVAGSIALGAGIALLLASGIALVSPLDAAAGWFGRHRRMGHGHAHDAESMREHSEFAIGWMLRKVDGTDQQKARLNEIVGALIDDVLPLGEEHRANRDAFVAELVRSEIDRARLEELRQAEIELADRASKDLIAALSDAAEALTEEQRLELMAFAESHRH